MKSTFLEVEVKAEAENCFAFEYNYISTFFQNKKLLNYLDIEVFFLIKLQLEREREREREREWEESGIFQKC